MRKITQIIVHCTATRGNQPVSMAQIDAWHRARGFNGIGYHYVVHQDGTTEPGRPVEEAGAHAKGHNAQSIGVAYVGGLNSAGLPADTRTPQQQAALLELLRHLKRQWLDATIIGHNQVSNKACPCFNASKEYENI